MTALDTEVVVVDDEPALRRLLWTSLGPQGYHVSEAATGADALRLVHSDNPDVVILDLGLPDLDGIEVIRRIGSQSTWVLARSFADVVDRLNDRLFRRGGAPRGILFLTADGIEQGTGFHFLVLSDTQAEAARREEDRASVARGERMCRLYGFRATEVTKVECTLAHAQNALIVQSEKHRHGWGMAIYRNQKPYIERQARAAMEDEGFRCPASTACVRRSSPQ